MGAAATPHAAALVNCKSLPVFVGIELHLALVA